VALLIDTDLLIDLERRSDATDLDRAVSGEEFAISVITVSELLHGVMRASGSRQTRRRAFVEYILAGLHAIPITPPVARVHADIWAGLAERGTVIGAHDLWIAATALAHGFGVATRDANDFGRVPGLRVVTP
jgi:tRNA(fMet)-specific endonuclease VapC